MGKLVNVSVKVPEEIRELMRKIDVNWSEYLRGVIEAKVEEELAKRSARKLEEIQKTSKKLPTEELVRWIREDRVRSLE